MKTAEAIQNALDLFKGEWVSKLPAVLLRRFDSDGEFTRYDRIELATGKLGLFPDEKILWALNQVDVTNRYVLDLGCLEGGAIDEARLRNSGGIVGIESNPSAFLRCLLVAQLRRWDNVTLFLGDVFDLLPEMGRAYLCIASGILYHQENPVELIALLSKHCDYLYLWTHYYDASVAHRSPNFRYDAFGYVHHEMPYPPELKEHLGNTKITTPCWLNREDLFACLEYFGFEVMATAFDEPNHPNGPAIAILAKNKNEEK